MFAYCGNNPVNYDDTSGNHHRSIGADIRTVYIDRPGSRWNALAELQRQGKNAPLVMDMAVSYQVPGTPFYLKGGVAFVMDFENCEMDLYFHGGGGIGYSSGISVSAGIVSDYSEPGDYAGVFFDVNAAYTFGLDHCWNPGGPHDSATKATSVTCSVGPSGGFGVDIYSQPFEIANWK